MIAFDDTNSTRITLCGCDGRKNRFPGITPNLPPALHPRVEKPRLKPRVPQIATQKVALGPCRSVSNNAWLPGSGALRPPLQKYLLAISQNILPLF